MKRTIVDSNVLIDASRADQRAVAFLRSAVDAGELWSITPVRTEVLWGLRASEHAVTMRLFDSLNWLDVSMELADRAGAFGQLYGKSHGLGTIDAMVAAAAEFLDGDLATLNVRHFPMFPGLQPPY